MRSTFKGNSYTLSLVAETGEQFSDFAPYVGAIDNRGVVAFQAALARSRSTTRASWQYAAGCSTSASSSSEPTRADGPRTA